MVAVCQDLLLKGFTAVLNEQPLLALELAGCCKSLRDICRPHLIFENLSKLLLESWAVPVALDNIAHALCKKDGQQYMCDPQKSAGIDATETAGEGTTEIAEKKAYEVGYKRMRPRTNKRSAFATKCMVLAAYLTVNMGIGCCIAVTTTWFWWVYMMMGILLFLLGVRIIIFGLSLVALVQFSRRHRRQRRAKADRAALELKAARAVRQASAQDMQLGQQQLSTAASAARQDSTQPLMRSAWSSFSAMQREASQMQLVLEVGKTGAAEEHI